MSKPRGSAILGHLRELTARRKALQRRVRSGARAQPKPGPMHGPWRKVVYIFEREGERGGPIWWLVLECGHTAARKRHEPKTWSATVYAMFEPIEKRFAPKRCQCHYCESGVPKSDPWIAVELFGGPKREL